jgi:hypothetical protein
MKKIIIAGIIGMVSIVSMAADLSIPPRKVMDCEDAAGIAAGAGFYKSKGANLEDVAKNYAEWAAANDKPADEREDSMRIIKWAYDQEESGNAALGKKYHDICTGKVKPDPLEYKPNPDQKAI